MLNVVTLSGRDSCQPYLQGAGRQPGEWETDGGVREAGQRGEKQLQPDSPTLSLSCTSSPCNSSIIVQFKLFFCLAFLSSYWLYKVQL